MSARTGLETTSCAIVAWWRRVALPRTEPVRTTAPPPSDTATGNHRREARGSRGEKREGSSRGATATRTAFGGRIVLDAADIRRAERMLGRQLAPAR